MEITSNYNSVYYLNNKEKLLKSIKNSSKKLKELENENEKEFIKLIQEINKFYDKGVTMQKLALKYKLSYTTINRYIWNPRPKGATVKYGL